MGWNIQCSLLRPLPFEIGGIPIASLVFTICRSVLRLRTVVDFACTDSIKITVPSINDSRAREYRNLAFSEELAVSKEQRHILVMTTKTYLCVRHQSLMD